MSETVTENNESQVSSPGAILKRCREYHNISLQEAAEETKVGTNYLRALEEDQVKEFASLAYLKGFLRIYASYLGLNSDDIMRIYEKMYNPVEGAKSQPGTVTNTKTKRRIPWQKLVLPAFLLLLLIITSAIMNRSKAPLPQPQIAATSPAPQPAAVVMPARSTAQAPKPEKTREVEEEETPQPERKPTKQPEAVKGFIVGIKATQNGTLAVTIDGSAPQNYDLAVGDSIEWKAERNIVLDISNGGGVEAELNGKSLGPLGSSGKSATVQLGPEGIKQ